MSRYNNIMEKKDLTALNELFHDSKHSLVYNRKYIDIKHYFIIRILINFKIF